MTLIEALKSNKRFRRKSMSKDRWYYIDCGYLNFHQAHLGDMAESSGFANLVNVEDMLADDWELEEDKLEFTKSDIIKVAKTVLKEAGLRYNRYDGSCKDIPEVLLADSLSGFLKALGYK